MFTKDFNQPSTSSHDATKAYNEGKKPISRWKKQDIITLINEHKEELSCSYDLLVKQPVSILRKLVLKCDGEWYYTSYYNNITSFYHFDVGCLHDVTDEEIEKMREKQKEINAQERLEKAERDEVSARYEGRWNATLIIRNRVCRFTIRRKLTGTVIKGYFYPDQEGMSKRSIFGKRIVLDERIS